MSWLGELVLTFHNWRNGVANVKAGLKKDPDPLRIGVISAAAINAAAIIDPVQTHPGAVLAAIAARDLSKAQAQIDKYSLGPSTKAYGSYSELLADPDIQAVYIPLPNGLHSEWAIKAMEAGKHVLVEKPVTSNAAEARKLRDVAAKTDRVALEAFHWRFHPAAHLVKSLVQGGEYGHPISVSSNMMFPRGVLGKDDIRFQYSLAGGASMDLTYVYSTTTYFASPNFANATTEVLRAKPRIVLRDVKVDEAMEAEFIVSQPNRPPVHCHTRADLAVPPFLGFIPNLWHASGNVAIELEKAKIEYQGFVGPYVGHKILVTEKGADGSFTGPKQTKTAYIDGPRWIKRGESWWTTYRWQLEAFVEQVRAKESGREYHGPWMSLEESVNLMELIDQVYVKANLPPRGT